jgi:hypothetical protein
MEKEVGKMKYTREKLRQQGKLGDRVNSSLSEINDVSYPSLPASFFTRSRSMLIYRRKEESEIHR